MADAFMPPPVNGNAKSHSGAVDAQMIAAESETPRASNESGEKLALQTVSHLEMSSFGDSRYDNLGV